MGKSEAVRLIAGLLRREAGISSAFAVRVVARALAAAGLETRRYFDDLDFEALLFQIASESDALAGAAARISRARAGAPSSRAA